MWAIGPRCDGVRTVTWASGSPETHGHAASRRALAGIGFRCPAARTSRWAGRRRAAPPRSARKCHRRHQCPRMAPDLGKRARFCVTAGGAVTVVPTLSNSLSLRLSCSGATAVTPWVAAPRGCLRAVCQRSAAAGRRRASQTECYSMVFPWKSAAWRPSLMARVPQPHTATGQVRRVRQRTDRYGPICVYMVLQVCAHCYGPEGWGSSPSERATVSASRRPGHRSSRSSSSCSGLILDSSASMAAVRGRRPWPTRRAIPCGHQV
jgi:hypothetical protein